MHRLQDLVRLHRMKTGAREVARLLGMSPNTERMYRRALRQAELLEGDPNTLPEMATLRAAVEAELPAKEMPQHSSSVEEWTDLVSEMLERGAEPTAIYDCLRLKHEAFGGSLSAIKRLCSRLKKAKGVGPGDVAIPVVTAAGEVAQVDFGSVALSSSGVRRLDAEGAVRWEAAVAFGGPLAGLPYHHFLAAVDRNDDVVVADLNSRTISKLDGEAGDILWQFESG